MSAKTAREIAGLEFDWIASDGDGHVAFFSTAGGGYVPEAVLRDTDAHDAAIVAILGVAAMTPALFEDTWRSMALRGLFAFDADFNGGPYRLVAAPAAPALVATLPPPAAQVARLVGLAQLRFAELTVVSRELLAAASAR